MKAIADATIRKKIITKPVTKIAMNRCYHSYAQNLVQHIVMDNEHEAAAGKI